MVPRWAVEDGWFRHPDCGLRTAEDAEALGTTDGGGGASTQHSLRCRHEHSQHRRRGRRDAYATRVMARVISSRGKCERDRKGHVAETQPHRAMAVVGDGIAA